MNSGTQIRALLKGGELLSSAEVARRLGLSQPTVWRVLKAMPDTVFIGAGRGSRCGLRHRIGNHGDRWPLFRINPDGQVVDLGELEALAGDQWRVTFRQEDPLLSAGLVNGISEGWPWFLHELCPQGFMGRAFAQQHSRPLGVSKDLNVWGSDNFLLAAYIYGSDLPGNILIGDHDIRLPDQQPEARWAEMAREAVAGNPPGSSAGGERPKFSNGIELVKFASRSGGESRWADLLVAEHLAGKVLRDHFIEAAHSRIVIRDNFVFLASRRFDRTDMGGRIGMHSLEALDGAFYGEGSGYWGHMGDLLRRDGWIDTATASRMAELAQFGDAIGNNDMHFGNLSFMPDDQDGLRLCPVYDMLPMRYAPTLAGDPGAGSIELPYPPAGSPAVAMATDYWQRVAEESRITGSFQRIGQYHLEALNHR